MKTIYYIGDSTAACNTIQTYPQTGMRQGLMLYVREDLRIFSRAAKAAGAYPHSVAKG